MGISGDWVEPPVHYAICGECGRVARDAALIRAALLHYSGQGNPDAERLRELAARFGDLTVSLSACRERTER